MKSPCVVDCRSISELNLCENILDTHHRRSYTMMLRVVEEEVPLMNRSAHTSFIFCGIHTAHSRLDVNSSEWDIVEQSSC